MSTIIPDCYYRISAKALIKNEADNILLIKENNGLRELPGGGLDFGETAQACIAREIKEEMGLEVTAVSQDPCLFFTWESKSGRKANVIYETTIQDLNFTPSEECTEIQFFSREEILQKDNLFPNVRLFAELLSQ